MGGRGERVLVVDDEGPICRYLVRLLTAHGFDSVGCGDGAEALQIFQAGRFDCVILDLVMPGMGGTEVFTRLRAIDPEIGIVICSGHPLNQNIDGLIDANSAYLKKPIGAGDLLLQVTAKSHPVVKNRRSPVA